MFFSGPNDSAQPSAGRPSAAVRVPFYPLVISVVTEICGHFSPLVI
jgi:hypothetical protein